jgi:hypothetical protein
MKFGGGAFEGLHHCDTGLEVLPTVTVPIASLSFARAIFVANS